jgi:hypothetical protein
MTKEYIDKLPSRWVSPYRIFYLLIIFLFITATSLIVLFAAAARQSEKYASPDDFEVVKITEIIRKKGTIVEIYLRHEDGYKITEVEIFETKKGKEIRVVVDKEASDEGKSHCETFYVYSPDFSVYLCGNGEPKLIYEINPK